MTFVWTFQVPRKLKSVNQKFLLKHCYDCILSTASSKPNHSISKLNELDFFASVLVSNQPVVTLAKKLDHVIYDMLSPGGFVVPRPLAVRVTAWGPYRRKKSPFYAHVCCRFKSFPVLHSLSLGCM